MPVKNERLRDAIDRAYLEKYSTDLGREIQSHHYRACAAVIDSLEPVSVQACLRRFR
jgi:hypothetical protein